MPLLCYRLNIHIEQRTKATKIVFEIRDGSITMTRVTIGMPAYNAEETIDQAIKSMLSQTYGDLKLLISDNASTDNTEEICRRYEREDPRVTYVRHEENLGATENYNYVCRAANSEFFKWHSSNDICSLETIERCVKVLSENPDIVLCYPQTRLFEATPDDGKDYQDLQGADVDSPIARFFNVIDNMALNNVMNGVVRADELKLTPLIRPFYYADRNMIAELALRGKIALVEGCYFHRRMDAASAIIMKSESDAMAHFDPSWERPLPFMNWRIYSAFLSSLFRSNIGALTAVRALPQFLRRVWYAKADLWGDIKTAIRYAAHDIRTVFSKDKRQDQQ